MSCLPAVKLPPFSLIAALNWEAEADSIVPFCTVRAALPSIFSAGLLKPFHVCPPRSMVKVPLETVASSLVSHSRVTVQFSCVWAAVSAVPRES